MKRRIEYRSLPHESYARIAERASETLVLIGVGGSVRFWYNDLTQTYYREWTCNGPSSWEIGEAVGVQ